MTDGAPDLGAQVERTGLAWERTALSGLACSLVIAKLIGLAFPVSGVAVALAGVATTAVVLVQARRRYRRAGRAITAAAALPDARVVGTLTALVVITAVGALGYALTVGAQA